MSKEIFLNLIKVKIANLQEKKLASENLYYRANLAGQITGLRNALQLISNNGVDESKISRYKWAKKIRTHAALIYPTRRFPICEKCGSPRKNIHHVKPLSSFSMEDSKYIINHRNNIQILCERCHMECHKI